MQGIKRILNSSKFWTALGALILIILVKAGVSEQTAGPIISAAENLAMVVIGAIAAEDIAQKLSGNNDNPKT